jgi:outer membrane protein assembly factor BamA
MAGPYLYLDWSIKLRDTLPRRHTEFPFALDCSKEVACHSGTTLKHSLAGGIYLNGCFTDDRYDPTMGYDAHLMGEVSGPPGDVGFWKMRGGASWHWPMELLQMMLFGVSEDVPATSSEEEPAVIGMTIHSSFNSGIIRPLSFNGLCHNSSFGGIPLSDRFYIGGPGQLRGFLPAGIGPRANKVSHCLQTYDININSDH